MSLWKVEDRATALLMEKFYQEYLEPEATTKAEALQKAKMWLRDYTDEDGSHPYVHPFYWSAFILIGGSPQQK